MLSVNYRLTIGSAALTLSDHSRLIDLHIDAALAIPVNLCRLALGAPQGLSLAPNDPVKVELGYDDDLTLVFTGLIERAEWALGRVTIIAAGAFQQLVAARLYRTYEKARAGDIVSDLAGSLSLSSSRIEAGLEFPTYALGANRTAYDEMLHLARQCGFDLYADTEDKVVFAPHKPATTHALQYGVNILALDFSDAADPLTGVEIFGESPASLGQGSEAYSWLTKQEVKGTAGTTKGLIVRRFDPTVRALEAATQVAEATLTALGQKQHLRTRILGAPEVKLGDAVRISDMPVSAQDGTFKVIRVTHTLNTKDGFVSVIVGEKK
jgi:hypothetical protein